MKATELLKRRFVSELPPSQEQIDNIVDLALAEDLSHGDITSDILIPPELQGKASVIAKAEGIVAGVEVAKRGFQRVDPSLEVEILINDGARVKPKDVIATVSGRVINILKAERTVLNFLQRLSGIATMTAQYVAKTKGFKTIILDTRKTTPGLRLLEKYAVQVGGGTNHRLDLGDWILIKDNHIVALRALGMSLKEIVAKAKQEAPKSMIIEAEVTTIQEALEAAEGGADMVMLDNMSPEEMQQVMSLIPQYVKIEASGGITLENVGTVATTGVDFVSSGALTHSVKVLNISIELEPPASKS
jgi:nicotinate-nucleotide pyrophosphorylase (carboxylating)